jgi:prophage regulatory protein
MTERILRRPLVTEKTGLGKTGIYDGVKAGTFPTPLQIGKRAVGWREADIDAWIKARGRGARRRIEKSKAAA